MYYCELEQKKLSTFPTVIDQARESTNLKPLMYTSRSTYLPIVGIVVTISPNLSLYKIVVFPAASNPTYGWKNKNVQTRSETAPPEKTAAITAGDFDVS